jgi:hypothetical protein
MTGQEMLDLLGLRLEDPDEVNFTEATKLDVLNVAQTTVANFLPNEYLAELQYKDSLTLSAFAGTVDISGGSGNNQTDYAPIRNAILEVEVKWGSDSLVFAAMITPNDAKKLENSYLTPTDSSPVAYVLGTNLYIQPVTITSPAGLALTVNGMNVWYLKPPTAITNATTSDLNLALHEIIVDLAEAQLWRMDNKTDRATAATNNASTIIGALANRFGIEAPEGIGNLA